MKFCDKLTMQRKKNNMSQELLADRLGVSRQAVSKWESGSSIPDMERIIELCRVLNCNLDDLMDDGVIGDKVKREEHKNVSFYLKGVLDFLTKSLNMFWSMRFRDKIKCIIEILFVSLIIYLLFNFIYFGITAIFSGVLSLFPGYLYRVIHGLFNVAYALLSTLLGIILVIHIFRIRYLNYFITIEDASARVKSIEAPVDEEDKEKKEDGKVNFIEKKKNKIIIRDPKHSTYSFFDFLARIVIFIIKGILLFVSFFGILSFVFLVCALVFSIIKMFSGLFFVGMAIGLLGALFVNYICLKVIFVFIFNQKSKFKISFVIFIIGLLLIGIGIGICFTEYLSFVEVEMVDKDSANYNTVTKEIAVHENTTLEFLENDNVNFVIDDGLDKIKMEVTFDNSGYVEFYKFTEEFNMGDTYYEVWNCFYYGFNNSFISEFGYVIDKIEREERILEYNYNDYIVSYNITGSFSNLELLKENYRKVFINRDRY